LFGFIHSSVMEWLVANEIASQLDDGVAEPPMMTRRPLTQLSVDFLCDLASSAACEAWVHRALAGDDGMARTNAVRVHTRLRLPAVGVSYGFEIGRIPAPVAYSADGDAIAVGSEDGGVLICDAAAALPVRTLQGHRGRVYAVAFGPPGTVLATGASDLTLRLWDPILGETLRQLDGHQEWIWPMLLNRTGTLLASGDASG